MWGIWGQNIPITNIVGESEILCWSAKWLDEDACYYSSVQMNGHNKTGRKKMLKEVHAMLDEADAVITFNGDKFDLKILNQEFALMGMAPPAPYKSIDLIKTVRRQFRFTSNKLDYLLRRFGLGHKLENPGIAMWLSCMNPRSEDYKDMWEIMEDYNIQDVFKTEEFYKTIRGWIPNHPSISAISRTFCCPNCGGTHLQSRGYRLSKTRKYRRYQCMSCGHWPSESMSEKHDDGAIILV